MADDRSLQEEEYEVVQSIYGEDCKVMREEHFCEVRLRAPGGKGGGVGGSSSVLLVRMHLPETYPSRSAPIVEIEATWLKEGARNRILQGLDEVYRTMRGEVIMFAWVEWIREQEWVWEDSGGESVGGGGVTKNGDERRESRQRGKDEERKEEEKREEEGEDKGGGEEEEVADMAAAFVTGEQHWRQEDEEPAFRAGGGGRGGGRRGDHKGGQGWNNTNNKEANKTCARGGAAGGGGGGGGVHQAAAIAGSTTIRKQNNSSREIANEVNLEELDKVLGIIHGRAFTEKKSTFQGHLAPVQSVDDVEMVMDALLRNRKIAGATHNIMAYRIGVPEKTGGMIQDFDDDGESAAGGRLLHLLQIVNATNVVVVVSRWFGGILLGPDRFKHINNAARSVLDACGYISKRPWGPANGGGGSSSSSSSSSHAARDRRDRSDRKDRTASAATVYPLFSAPPTPPPPARGGSKSRKR